jgi:hypothetical protein
MIINELCNVFSRLVSKISSVSSKCFQTYKLKDVTNTFVALIEQFGRLQVFEFLPDLSSILVQFRLEAGFAHLNKAMTHYKITLMKHRFETFKQNSGLTRFYTSTMKK